MKVGEFVKVGESERVEETQEIEEIDGWALRNRVSPVRSFVPSTEMKTG